MESEETQDYVREAKDVDLEEAEEISFVRSANSVPQKSPCFGVAIDAVKKPSVSCSLRRW